jgi:predicted AAA+ superfamily ATPase
VNNYLPRFMDELLDELMTGLSAISLEGAKGVGKTETAKRRAETIYELDDPELREIISAEPSRLLEGESPILIDEWQRVPESWDIVRRAVDNDSSPGRFLLTGSSRPKNPPTHSGAGRIVTLQMRPLSLAERQIESPTVPLSGLLNNSSTDISGETDLTLDDYTDEILRSGFPGLRCHEGRALREHLKSYVSRIVETDFKQLGRDVRKPDALMRWLKAYAAAVGTPAQYEVIRDAATGGQGDKPSRQTTSAYVSILEKLWILEDVPGWQPTRNYFSRLMKSPKRHLVDPALAVRLLGLQKNALVRAEETDPPIPRDGAYLGHLFESLVTQSVRVYAQKAEAEAVNHLRLRGGRHEVDLIVRRGDGCAVALEVKLGNTVESDDVKHLLWLEDKMGDDLLDSAVITTGSYAYRREDGIAVIPAGLLGP